MTSTLEESQNYEAGAGDAGVCMVPTLVSIIVCAWNNWPDVEMTVESALRQSYGPLEVIVVDNSSADATPAELPRRFGHRIRYIRQPNKECAGAYNTGLDASCGEFIQFVDGDDVLAPNKIEKQLEVFRANPELDIVYGDVRMFQTGAGVARWSDPSTQKETDILLRILAPEVGICALGMLFRRRALEKTGRWDEELYVEDLDYLLRAAWAGCRFGHCQVVPMGFAREHEGQKTRNADAMSSGVAAVWAKALGFVTREPYRSLIAGKLARYRLGVALALARDPAARTEALAMLALARATSPEAISRLADMAVQATIVLPSGVLRSPLLRPIRNWFVARLSDRQEGRATKKSVGLSTTPGLTP